MGIVRLLRFLGLRCGVSVLFFAWFVFLAFVVECLCCLLLIVSWLLVNLTVCLNDYFVSIKLVYMFVRGSYRFFCIARFFH